MLCHAVPCTAVANGMYDTQISLCPACSKHQRSINKGVADESGLPFELHRLT
jgi:hypothetical protein